MRKTIINANLGVYLNYSYLMLPVSLRIVSKIKLGAKMFYSKEEYHVSLLRLQDFSVSEQKQILNFAQKYLVKLKEITKTYRLIKEENHQSLIVRVRLQGLRKLILDINKHFDYSFVYPPTHITLFILKDMESGIGINSTSEYKHLAYPISQPDSQKLANSFELIK